ncbi:hypothetical protein ACFCV3_22620 [Kribbella sp. NPDC056345]|uniref:hypothetical protein n=1 Tax=Kribbella sp. NPDC056345 TaxID=3345789 RepID=UPI0035DCBCAE
MRVSSLLALSVASVAALGACGANPEPAAPPADATGVLMARQDARPAPSTMWKTRDVFNAFWSDVAGPGRLASNLALTSAGALVVTESPAPKVGAEGKVTLYPADLSVRIPGQRPAVISKAPKAATDTRQIIAASAGRSGLTWLETTSTSLAMQDWRIHYQPADGQPRLVGDSDALYKTRELPPPPGGIHPQASADGRIYWAAAAPDRTSVNGFTALILAADTTGRTAPRPVVRNAKLPRVVGSTLYYVVSPDVAPGKLTGRFEIHALTAGVDKVIASGVLEKDQQLERLVAGPTHLAWYIGTANSQAEPSADPDEGCADRSHDGCSIFVQKLGSAEPPTRIAASSTGVEMSLDGSLLGWGSGSSNGDPGEYLLDLNNSKLWRLGDSRGCSSVSIAGSYISWGKSDAAGRCGVTVAQRI